MKPHNRHKFKVCTNTANLSRTIAADLTPSQLAQSYLPSVRQLLDLSSAIDGIACNPGSTSGTRCFLLYRHVWRLLKNEAARLSGIKEAVSTFVHSRRGALQFAIENSISHEAQHRSEQTTTEAGKMIVLTMLEKALLFKFPLPEAFGLNETDVTLLRGYFARADMHGPLNHESVPRFTPPSVSIEALERAIIDCDFASLLREVSNIGTDLVARSTRLSATLDKCVHTHKPSDNAENRRNSCRIRAALILESDRSALLRRAIDGVIRCFCGQQRIAREAARIHAIRAESDLDREFSKIVNDVIARLAQRINTSCSTSPTASVLPQDEQ